MKAMFKKSTKAIRALNVLGLAASEAGRQFRMFVDVYLDLEREQRRLYFVRLP